MDDHVDSDINAEEVATLHPLNFHLKEANKSKAASIIDVAALSRNTQFLICNYMGEIAQFVNPWKSEVRDVSLSSNAESKSSYDDMSADSKGEAKSSLKPDDKDFLKNSDIAIPDTLVYVEVVPELSAKAKRKLAVAKLSDVKHDSCSDSDSERSSSSFRRKSRHSDGERKSIRFADSDDYDERYGGRDSYYNDSDSKSDRYRSDDKEVSSFK